MQHCIGSAYSGTLFSGGLSYSGKLTRYQQVRLVTRLLSGASFRAIDMDVSSSNWWQDLRSRVRFGRNSGFTAYRMQRCPMLVIQLRIDLSLCISPCPLAEAKVSNPREPNLSPQRLRPLSSIVLIPNAISAIRRLCIH